MQGEENGATTESKKQIWVFLEDPQHVLRKGIDWVSTPRQGEFEPVNQFKDKTIGQIQEDWSNRLLFRCRLEDHPDYQCPKKEPLRWVENCKPDKPGIWARIDKEMVSFASVENEDIDTITWDSATRCYLGPIPEILPPKKKVVQRLWVLPQYGEAGICRWFYEDEPMAVNWIRTDETREVEE